MADVAIKSEWTRLKRAVVVSYEDLRPGEYMQLQPKFAHSKTLWCVVRCLECGNLSSIGRSLYDVDWRGAVSPQSRCPTDSCRSHWLLLLNWHPDTKGDA